MTPISLLLIQQINDYATEGCVKILLMIISSGLYISQAIYTFKTKA
jgi:hypothetical protein